MTQHESTYDDNVPDVHWSHRSRTPTAAGMPIWLVGGILLAWPVALLRMIMPFALLYWALERLLGRPPLAGILRIRSKRPLDARFMSSWLVMVAIFLSAPGMAEADFFLIDASASERRGGLVEAGREDPGLRSMPDADWIASQNPAVGPFEGRLDDFMDQYLPEPWRAEMDDHHAAMEVQIPGGLRLNDALQLIAAENELIIERDYSRNLISVADAETQGTGRLAIRGFQLPSSRPAAPDARQDAQGWTLTAGEWLSDELKGWAEREGLSLDWALPGSYDWRVSHNASFTGSFVEALEALHQVYMQAGDMHDVEFSVRRGNGVLVVREIDPALVGR